MKAAETNGKNNSVASDNKTMLFFKIITFLVLENFCFYCVFFTAMRNILSEALKHIFSDLKKHFWKKIV